MSFNPIEGLKYLANHPYTQSGRASMPMKCSDCEMNGVRPEAIPPNQYQHGDLRWSSDLIHQVEVHGHHLPEDVLAKLPWIIENARKAEALPPVEFYVCPQCSSRIAANSQSPPSFLCHKCGFMLSGRMPKAIRRGDLPLKSSEDASPSSSLRALYSQRAPAEQTLFALLEEIQGSPSCQSFVAKAPIDCARCKEDYRKAIPIYIGSYYFGGVSWSSQLLHDVLLHGKSLPSDLVYAIKAYKQQQSYLGASWPTAPSVPRRPFRDQDSRNRFPQRPETNSKGEEAETYFGNIPIY